MRPRLDPVVRSIVLWLAERLEKGRLSIDGSELGEKLKAGGAGSRFLAVFKHLEALGILEPRYATGPDTIGTLGTAEGERLGRPRVIYLSWHISGQAIEISRVLEREDDMASSGRRDRSASASHMPPFRSEKGAMGSQPKALRQEPPELTLSRHVRRRRASLFLFSQR